MAIIEQLETLDETADVIGLSLAGRFLTPLLSNDTATITAMRDASVLQEDIDYFQMVLDNLPNIHGSGGGSPWNKYTVTTADLTAGATSQAITLFTTSANEVIEGCLIKQSTAFSGGGISTCTVEVGVSGDTQRYAPAYDIFQAVSDAARQSTNVLDFEPSAAAIQATVTADANVSGITAGSFDVYISHRVLP